MNIFTQKKLISLVFAIGFLCSNNQVLASRIVSISEDFIPQRNNSRIISNLSYGQEDIDEVKNHHKELVSMDLRVFPSQGSGLSVFSVTYPHLTELYISKISFLTQILERLPESTPFLETLILDEARVLSSSLHNLSSLKKLSVLGIANACITDREHIEELLETSQNLEIYATNFANHPPYQSIDVEVFRGHPRFHIETYSLTF